MLRPSGWLWLWADWPGCWQESWAPAVRAGLGAVCFIAVCAAFSTDLRAVRWRTVLWGIAIQLGLALLILRFEVGGERPGYAFFSAVGNGVKRFLEFSNQGALFVFGPLANPAILEPAFGGLAWLLADVVGPRGQSAMGAPCFIAICAVFSTDLGAVRWRTILWGIAIQLGLDLLILRFEVGGVKPGYAFCSAVGRRQAVPGVQQPGRAVRVRAARQSRHPGPGVRGGQQLRLRGDGAADRSPTAPSRRSSTASRAAPRVAHLSTRPEASAACIRRGARRSSRWKIMPT